MAIQEFVGRVIGATVAPLTFLGSLVRGKRLFHPDGVVYRAEVEPIAQGGALGRLAQRLAGTALVRLSGGLWPWRQGERGPDVLGVVVRLRSVDDVTPRSLPGDQDLLMISAPSLPGIVRAALRTDVNDFLNNEYYAILPFSLAGVGKVYLRLVPLQSSPAGADRRERLDLAVAEGRAVLRLEIQVEGEDEGEGQGEGWISIAELDLRERLSIEDAELTIHPGSSAKGLVPRGVLQWVRPAAYAASHAGWRVARRRGDRAEVVDVVATSAAGDEPHGEPAEGGLEQK